MSGTRTSSHAGEVPTPLLGEEWPGAAVVRALRPELCEEPLVRLRPDRRKPVA
jgi:hypothetical protein